MSYNLLSCLLLYLAAISLIHAQQEEPQKKKWPDLISIAEVMPRFPGCEHLDISKTEKDKCAQTKLIQYLRYNKCYPTEAREMGIEGVAVVRFTIDEKGKVIEPKILRDPGAGLGQEALRVVEKMAEEVTWIPSYQGGKAIRIKLIVPIRFRLANIVYHSHEVTKLPQLPSCGQAEAPFKCSEALVQSALEKELPPVAQPSTIMVAVEIDAEGHMGVPFLKNAHAAKHPLAQQGLEAVNELRISHTWEPARLNHKPVAIWYDIPVYFQ